MSKVESGGKTFVAGLLDELNSLSTITETYELPSKGRLDGIQPTVTLRMMTTFEEKIRTGSRTSFWRTISSIMNKCIVSPEGLDTYKLTVNDFIFLMYKLRIVSYGKDYKINVSRCPECGSKLKDISVDLDKLNVVTIDDMNIELVEPMKIHLPITNWDIECRLLRMNEYDEIQQEAGRILEEFPTYEGDPMVPLRLAHQIVKIKGEPVSKIQVETIVNKLPAADQNVIVQTFDDITMGLDTTAEFICPRCKKPIKVSLAYTEEFFRPSI